MATDMSRPQRLKRPREKVDLAAFCNHCQGGPVTRPLEFGGRDGLMQNITVCSAECALAHVQRGLGLHPMERLQAELQAELQRPVLPALPSYLLHETDEHGTPRYTSADLRYRVRQESLTPAEQALAAAEDEFRLGPVDPRPQKEHAVLADPMVSNSLS